MNTQRFPFDRARGFTLVELLVTVAIIGVLAGLSLSFSRTATESVRTMKCSAQMRSIWQAINLYKAEHDNFFPPNRARSDGTIDNCWVYLIRPHMGINQTDKYGAGAKAMAALVTCPAATGSEIPANWWESNYSVSLYLNPDGSLVKDFVKNPSQTMMLIETVNKNRAISWTPPPLTQIAYRHLNHSNVLFFDGHVEKLQSSQVPTNMNDVFWGTSN